jgi:hypothetical protein
MARLQPFGNELSPANQELERNVAFRQWNTTPRSVTFRGLSIRPVTTGAVPQVKLKRIPVILKHSLHA